GADPRARGGGGEAHQREVPAVRQGRGRGQGLGLQDPDDRLLLRQLQGQVRRRAREVHRQGRRFQGAGREEGREEEGREEGRRQGHQREVPAVRQGHRRGPDLRVQEAADRLLLRELQGQVRQGAREVHREGQGVQEGREQVRRRERVQRLLLLRRPHQ